MVLSSADIFFKISLFVVFLFFLKNLSGISVVSSSLDPEIMAYDLLGLIWVQIFAKVISRRH